MSVETQRTRAKSVTGLEIALAPALSRKGYQTVLLTSDHDWQLKRDSSSFQNTKQVVLLELKVPYMSG